MTTEKKPFGLTDDPTEQAARRYFDPKNQLDWTMPENHGVSAVQRAYFRAGMREGLALADAAPDMLQALQAAYAMICEECADGEHHEVAKKAAAAIAKATGSTS